MTHTILAPAREINPIRPDFRTLPIETGFDWPPILEYVADEHGLDLTDTKLYAVAFYSLRRQLSNREDQAALDTEIAEADAAAHEEAINAAEPVLYYYPGEVSGKPGDAGPGLPDIQPGLSLSWCLWRSREGARAAPGGPGPHLCCTPSPPVLLRF